MLIHIGEIVFVCVWEQEVEAQVPENLSRTLICMH